MRQMDGRKRYIVSGVCCSTEEGVLRKSLDATLGNNRYEFTPATCELVVEEEIDERDLVRSVRRAGFTARAAQNLAPELSFWERHQAGVFTGLASLLMIAGIILGWDGQESPVAHVLLCAAVVAGGWKVFVKALKSLRLRSLDMNVLMSVAVIGALLIGKWVEGSAVVVLFSASLMLESYSATRTRRAVQSLVALAPTQATVFRDGKEVRVVASDVNPGSVIVILPGEKIPLDGFIESGYSDLSEAAITGEALPVAKSAGDAVFAGSVNALGTLTVRVTKHYHDTTLSRIIHLIEEAHTRRAPIQMVMDRFARIYTPVVMAGAVVIALVPSLLLHAPFEQGLYQALVLLVIACPCALVISTPVTLVSALTNAARNGVLVKGGKHLETISGVRAIAFDKTGTLTEGRPRITEIVQLDTLPRQDLLRILAAMEKRSEHHLADAVLAEVMREGIDVASLAPEQFEAIPGMGVKAKVEGAWYYLGNRTLGEKYHLLTPHAADILDRFAREGKTGILLGRPGEPLCVLAASDAPRLHSRDTVSRLQRMGLREVVMLSGDHAMPTARAAAATDVSAHQAGLLPEEKVAAVEDLKRRYGIVAMVGDGVNDAPALAASSVGIAMGVVGTDAALETADVILMSDDLGKLPYLFGLSRAALRVVRQNITLALGLKILFVGLSLAGHATLWTAVLADDGAALVVIANGLRLLSYTDRS
jgi:Cd2+/Zn2+-exporting ATPase